MPREDVDAAALAVDRERDLGNRDPADEAREPTGHRLEERGMVRIQEPVELRAAPAKDEIESDLERPTDRAERAEGDVVEQTPLDA